MENGQSNGCKDCGGTYILIKDEEDPRLAMFNKPLPCCGCGIGWCSLLLGFVCPLIWYYAAILYLCSYYNRDPRERSGLAANAIAITSWTVGFTTDGIEVILFRRREQGLPNKMGLRRKINVDVSLQSTAWPSFHDPGRISITISIVFLLREGHLELLFLVISITFLNLCSNSATVSFPGTGLYSCNPHHTSCYLPLVEVFMLHLQLESSRLVPLRHMVKMTAREYI